MRRPSNRAELWRAWREHVEQGEPWSFDFHAPACGRFKAKRNGQWVGVQIDLEPGEIDAETGELISDETFVAFIGTEKFTGERVFSIWERCGDKPINDTEFRRLAGLPAQIDLTRDVIT